MPLNNFLNELLSKPIDRDYVRTVLAGAGCSQSFIHIMLEESAISIGHLKMLARRHIDPNNLDASIRIFLKKRWACIIGSDLGYISFPHSPLNHICIQLAQGIAQPGESLAQILMPTLAITEYIIASDNLINLTENDQRELLFGDFLISEDGKAIIHFKSWFEAQENNTGEFYNHLYALEGRTVALTDHEKHQLRHCAMPFSDDFFDALELRKKIMSDEETLAGELVKFCNELKINGMGHKGTIENAHDDVFNAIREFDTVLKRLTAAQQAHIFNLKANYKEFKFYWNILSGFDAKKSPRNAPTCVQENGNELRNILEKNLHEFAKIKFNKPQENANTPNRPTIHFASYYENIKSKINNHQLAFKAPSIFIDVKSAIDALRFYSPNNISIVDEKLSIYARHLENEGTEYQHYHALKSIAQLEYYQAYCLPDEMDLVLRAQGNVKLEEFFKKSDFSWAKLLLSKSYFTPPENALNDAAANGNLNLVRAYIDAKRPLGSSLSHAMENENHGIALLLIEAGAEHSNVIIQGEPLLIHAVSNELVLICRALLARNDIDINVCDRDGDTALLIASVDEHNELIELLIDHHADMTFENNDGWTALEYAAYSDNTSLGERMLAAGALIDHQDKAGDTSLHIAADQGNLDFVKLLLTNHAKMNIQNNKKQTPMEMAIEKERIGVICELIYTGAAIRAFKKTPLLIYAIQKEWGVVIDALLTHADINLNAQDQGKRTPLHYAVIYEDGGLFSHLMTHKANPNTKDKDGYSPLFYAIQMEIVSFALNLVHAGADLNQMITYYDEDEDEDETCTLLMYAIRQKMYPVFFAWMDADGDVASITPQSYLEPIINYCLEQPYPKTHQSYIKNIFLMGNNMGSKAVLILDRHIVFTVNELLSSPHLNQLKNELGFEKLSELCQVKPNTYDALKIYAACVALTLPQRAAQIHRVIHSGSPKDLCELVHKKARQSSRYTRSLPAVDPWEDMPKELKDFVASTTVSRKRSHVEI